MELSQQEKTLFKDLFAKVDLDKDGIIGPQDAAFFRKSNLSDAVLGQVITNILLISLDMGNGQ